MKYYSELTKSFYESEEACINDENKMREKLEAAENEKRRVAEVRRQRAAEVDKARENYLTARKQYNEVLSKFCEDYGSYHCSIKDSSPDSYGDLLETFLNLF